MYAVAMIYDEYKGKWTETWENNLLSGKQAFGLRRQGPGYMRIRKGPNNFVGYKTNYVG